MNRSIKKNQPVKKYQVFISSTYEDLQDVRIDIMHTILDTNNIPVGMENFSASNDRGWGIITQTIDNSDFCVLIVAGKYGTVDEKTGKSWTEKEYDYAKKKKVPVLAFIRDNDKIPPTLFESDAHTKNKLNNFIEKIKTDRHIKSWKESIDLQSSVVLALNSEIKRLEPQVLGWYRGNNTVIEKESITEIKKGNNIVIEKSVTETTMRYYHAHLTVSGAREDCHIRECKLLYYASSLVVSPEKPIIFKDHYKTSKRIGPVNFSKPAKILNPAEFKRDSQDLEFSIKSNAKDDVLYFNAEAIFYVDISKEKGGFGLHIPHYADHITFIIDMSHIELVPDSEPSIYLVIRGADDMKIQRKDRVKVDKYHTERIWVVSAHNAPVDSDIEFNWGYSNEKAQTAVVSGI
jgi:hypothetical protein